MKSRTAKTRTFSTHDGIELFYRRWPALTAKPKGAIVMFHRGHEHSARMAHLVHELNLAEFDFFAWDARGHGRSPGERGFSPSASTSVRDVQNFIDHISSTYGFKTDDMLVLGQSVGAVLAAGWVHDYAPNIRGLVLAAPAFEVKLYVPFARPLLKARHAVTGDFFVNSYVKAKLLTHDPERIASFEQDPLIARPISVNMLLGLHELSKRIVADAAAITVPTQLLISGSDWVVRQAPQNTFFDRLGASIKERHVFDGFYHDTLGERDRAIAIGKARSFIVDRFSRPAEAVCLRAADKRGFTYNEARQLATPLTAFSPRDLYWRATRIGLNVGSYLSKGIAVGRSTGFDSGTSLDYVYENQPRGRTLLGRIIDRSYLDSVGWKGIRHRKVHIEELLGNAIERTRNASGDVRILDIAAGHGRYVLDAIEQCKDRPDAVLLRDFDARNVAAGNDLIRQRGLSDVATFVEGDAFDGDSIAAVKPRPTIGIVSGLYELFPDNTPIQASLDGLSRAIAPGGYLVYTCQPWHPQLELIARCLTSHRDGKPWVMRRRSQAEMDQLVAAAGFKKIDQRIDEWGIFTVALAQRQSR